MRGKPPGLVVARVEHVGIDVPAWRSLQFACYHPAMSADPLLTLRPTHLTLEAEALAQHEGREVRVPGAFGGETVEAKIVARSRHHARDFAALTRVVTPHPKRRPPPCPRHEEREGRCGGCPLMPLSIRAQREQKRLMLAALGLDVQEVVGGDALGYRWSSKRVAFAEDDRLALGSWAKGSHVGASMEGCLVDHPKLTAAADELVVQANALGVTPYDERAKTGDLRYVWLKTDGERVLVTLITAAEESAAESLARALTLPTGVAWSVQGEVGNAMRGEGARLLRGEGLVRTDAFGAAIEVGPLGFLQPNPRVIALAQERLLTDASGAPISGRLAWDLYAGAGATTRKLEARFDVVRACESHPESAAALGVAPQAARDFLAAQTEAPDLVIANPPRKGLGEAVVDALARLRPRRLHLMECGPAGLARDLEQLRAAGFTLTSLAAFDSLPQTPHVELVARLTL